MYCKNGLDLKIPDLQRTLRFQIFLVHYKRFVGRSVISRLHQFQCLKNRQQTFRKFAWRANTGVVSDYFESVDPMEIKLFLHPRSPF
jgi:predicted membrane GTPase involved in stress response